MNQLSPDLLIHLLLLPSLTLQAMPEPWPILTILTIP